MQHRSRREFQLTPVGRQNVFRWVTLIHHAQAIEHHSPVERRHASVPDRETRAHGLFAGLYRDRSGHNAEDVLDTQQGDGDRHHAGQG
jgi:hypothetical protein